MRNIREEDPHGNSPAYQVWWPRALCSRDIMLLGCIVISQYNVSTGHVTLWTEAHQRELHS